MKNSTHYMNLSDETAHRIENDRLNHIENPYACQDGAIIRRDPSHDIANLHRPAFVRDIEKIMNVPYYNRYSDKTQVFSLVRNDDISRRALHVQYVSRIARNIGRLLGLNTDLIEAIALGHDIGHTPFGHAGERALNEVCPFGFRHYEQSIRVVEKLERDGNGLNLTKEVRDGILNHQWNLRPSTLEGQIVRFCDKIAYINHDIDDAERAGIMTEEDIPDRFRKSLGGSTKERLDTLINDIIYQSIDSDEIHMSPDIKKEMEDLRHFMYENLYTDSIAKIEEKKVPVLLKILYQYYEQHIDEMPDEYVQLISNGEAEPRVVCDYISGMTDPYAVQKFEELFIPKSWPKQ